MRPAEERLLAAVEELKNTAAKTLDKTALLALDRLIHGLERMRPYVSVGLRVRPSPEALDAMVILQEQDALTTEQWKQIQDALELARRREVPQIRQLRCSSLEAPRSTKRFSLVPSRSVPRSRYLRSRI